MPTSHYTIASHRLIALAEVNTVSQDWGYLLFKLSLAEALEEIATSISEEAWLYNENAFNICFYNIHCFNFCSYHKIFSNHPVPLSKEGIFLPLRLSCKESSTFLTKPLFNGLYNPFGSPVSGGQKPSGTRGCSWRRYSLRQSFSIVRGACAHKGLPMIV